MQPKIMVIPYTKEGEDIRTVLEKDANKRIVLTKIKEAFDERGVSTIDFVAKLKAIESGEIFNMENKGDIKSQIIDMSGADIYVEAEIVCQQNRVNGQTNPESFVKIIITSYDAATGSSLSNKVGESGHFYTKDIAKLAMRAIASCADDFCRSCRQNLRRLPKTEGPSCCKSASRRTLRIPWNPRSAQTGCCFRMKSNCG